MNIHKYKTGFGFLLTIFVLSSCAQPEIIEPTATVFPTITPLPTATATLTPTPIGSGLGEIVFVGEEEKNKVINSNVYSIKVDGTDRKNLTNNENLNVRYMSPKYSPDGKSIAFCRVEGISGLSEKAEVFTMDRNGENTQKITTSIMFQGKTNVSDSIQECYPNWSPDGSKLVVSSNRDTLKIDDEIYIIDLKTYEGEKITEAKGSNSNPTWSPDGKKICFMSNRYGDWDLFIENLEDNKLFQLTSSKATERFPSWSPDGEKIVFHSDIDGNIEIYTVNVDGSDLIRLTTNPAVDTTASWSKDGKWLVFHSDRDGDEEIFIMRADGSDEQKITNNSLSDWTASWAP